MLLLLAPVLAFAQGGPNPNDMSLNQEVVRSPLSWAWVAILALAVAAFVAYTMKISRHRRPPNRPSMP